MKTTIFFSAMVIAAAINLEYAQKFAVGLLLFLVACMLSDLFLFAMSLKD